MGLVSVDNEITHKARVWQAGLSGLKREWVEKAILKLVNANTGFIPELSAFKALCLEFKPREYYTKPVDDFVPLPAELHKAKIAELKKAIGVTHE